MRSNEIEHARQRRFADRNMSSVLADHTNRETAEHSVRARDGDLIRPRGDASFNRRGPQPDS